jgi:glycosyltransferase involved in cell wall biosynthesis
MKILYVTTISSTMNAFFKAHIDMLVADGHRVDLACNDADWPIDRFYEELGCESHHVDFSRRPLSADNLKAYRQLGRLIREGGYDLVHCHTPNAAVITRLVCRRLRKKRGLKVLYTAHGFHFYQGAPKLNWLVFYPIEKLCSRFTDDLITINTEDYELAKTRFHAKRVYYSPGVGIDVAKFQKAGVDRAAVRREIGVPEEAFLLMSVGELNANKNHQVVLKALAQLGDPRIHYAVAGVGEHKERLLALADELGVAEQFHLLGYRRDIPDLLCAADVFCFPSIREGLGLAAVEAMAGGLPVVAADNRGTRSFVASGINGYVCAHGDADGFATAIAALMKDEDLRERMGQEGRRTAEGFSVQHVLQVLKEVYG